MKALFGALLFCASVGTSQAQNVEFKGIPMGISLDELRAKADLPSLSCTDLGEDTSSCWVSKTGTTYAGQSVLNFSADFLGAKLANISMQTLGGTASKISQALSAKYGNPKVKRTVIKTLKNGSKYTMYVTTWRLSSGDEIAIEDHQAPVNEVYTALTSKSWVKWRNHAQKITSKEKKDI
jgi:hypothetical protein